MVWVKECIDSLWLGLGLGLKQIPRFNVLGVHTHSMMCLGLGLHSSHEMFMVLVYTHSMVCLGLGFTLIPRCFKAVPLIP